MQEGLAFANLFCIFTYNKEIKVMNTENLNTQELETLRTLLNKMASEPKTAKVDQTEVMITNIISEFNFPKVQATMQALNWRWAYSSHTSSPTTLELRQQATKLLRSAIRCRLDEYKHEHWEMGIHCATGGFDATAYCNEDKTKITGLKLQFVVTEWEVDLENLTSKNY
jgi:carotenoid cleavage dioxygenase-like enzyme